MKRIYDLLNVDSNESQPIPIPSSISSIHQTATYSHSGTDSPLSSGSNSLVNSNFSIASRSTSTSLINLASASTTNSPSRPSSATPTTAAASAEATAAAAECIPKTKISSKYLINKNIIKIAIRRKSASKKSSKPISLDSHSKLHLKSLEAGIKIKLTLAPSLISLYKSLTPNINVKSIKIVESSCGFGETASKFNSELNSIPSSSPSSSLKSKNVQLVDNNLVNLSSLSNKILQTFRKDSLDSQVKYPIYNCLNTAMHSLFGVDDYTFIRVTRSSSNTPEGSTLLKLEAANPGDYWLIDEEEFYEEMFYSIGKKDDVPSNLFIKKILARPRYKADMKIYVVPTRCITSLYVDERMLERDLIKGVVDPKKINQRPILTTFDYHPLLKEINHLIDLSNENKD
ncbi:hypothetical protein CLIB1423_06S02652 [[Candida] railenensis]|uniref:Uncharacterized protein n=1 Tax=[Candida] railenensis TaxID=45579 RepID=A0A9P0QPF0_9ASCO|nr:hypothetical protein CLIB1423_06S02652 [[Candida] railenensis]